MQVKVKFNVPTCDIFFQNYFPFILDTTVHMTLLMSFDLFLSHTELVFSPPWPCHMSNACQTKKILQTFHNGRQKKAIFIYVWPIFNFPKNRFPDNFAQHAVAAFFVHLFFCKPVHNTYILDFPAVWVEVIWLKRIQKQYLFKTISTPFSTTPPWSSPRPDRSLFWSIYSFCSHNLCLSSSLS